MGVFGVVQAALAAGLVQPDAVVDLLPEATTTPTVTPTATLQPSATPTATATITPSPTQTALPTATPTNQPIIVPTALPTHPPTTLPTAANTPQLEILPTAEAGVVIGDSGVNVRKGPGTEFEIIAVLPPGTPVQLIGKSEAKDWEHVRLPDGRAGWISAALVSHQSVSPSTGAGQDGDCDHPGKYCEAPGQAKNNIPGNNGNGPGQGNDEPDKNDHPPGNDNNQGRDSPPNNPGQPINSKDEKGKQ
jgi:hypothetical protein